jgi:hypothetical protein
LSPAEAARLPRPNGVLPGQYPPPACSCVRGYNGLQTLARNRCAEACRGIVGPLKSLRASKSSTVRVVAYTEVIHRDVINAISLM